MKGLKVQQNLDQSFNRENIAKRGLSELKGRCGNLSLLFFLINALQMAFCGLNSSFKNLGAKLEGTFFFLLNAKTKDLHNISEPLCKICNSNWKPLSSSLLENDQYIGNNQRKHWLSRFFIVYNLLESQPHSQFLWPICQDIEIALLYRTHSQILWIRWGIFTECHLRSQRFHKTFN